MLTLITGAPGAGKSLRAVHELKEALASGRPCYADIAELNMPGVLPAPIANRAERRTRPSWRRVRVALRALRSHWPDGMARTTRVPDQKVRRLRDHGA